MYKATTIKDIARALGISTSTVSRGLRDSHEVSAETKKAILEYAKNTNYHSNPVALSLKNRRTYSIGVMVADIANSFFSQTINGIESIAYEKGYHVIITQSQDSYDREVINIEHLAHRSVDGLLISMSAQTTDYNHIKKLHEQGLPMVFFDRIIDDIKTYKVTTDNFKSAYDATDVLIKKGYKKIAHLTNAPQLSITVDRLNGYKAALAAHHIGFDNSLVRYCGSAGRDLPEVEQAVNSLLSQSQQPDALLIASDRLSTGAMRALKTFCYTGDMAIVGFSNSEVIDLLSPKISYVRQKAFEMGQIAAEMLIKLIESKYPIYEFETRLLDAELFWQEDEKLLK